MELKSTREVAKLLRCRPGNIAQAIHEGKAEAPEKLGGSYAWTPDDIMRLSWQLFSCSPETRAAIDNGQVVRARDIGCGVMRPEIA